ncbi:L-ascorbate peroxidase-like protein [Hapsidospora chrysogenum ATCC 11550]|uniref:Peroxidase n=1 Tax=Hapsidospora chrysogenum (strain ATCC 11550 / CBS 779.69 / DSM 880 / IAM 14645 / JCM 23072 / IMI 49137) TaxID=857340 RepID=A0A086TDA7_HAPC1|nr:L-ascorbate peroxidase-like protein [Hapsidospora chrysogenum ATCC 11550]
MKSGFLLTLLALAGGVLADPTWPSEIDELEEIMFQLASFRARKFADTVSPCGNEASGPGRLNAAEWLRTAFHDMSTASLYFRAGGLDASLQYELTNGENKGPGLSATIEFMARYLSRKSSLADLIALGVYMSVRSCGGPAVPIRAGRKDATTKGSSGVPQPENSPMMFEQQFDRMGFNVEEMIQLTACGHSIGGVHSEQFPDIVPSGTGRNGQIELDSSAAVFDNRVVTEYLNGSTKNPLVVGPAVKINKHSDFKVFNSDGNATVKALTDPQTFQDVCRKVLQKMVEVVPPGVALTEPITPYDVKPVNLQLTLTGGGRVLRFTGYIRVRTTMIHEHSIESVTIAYKNRDGESNCGSGGCTITTTVQGVGQGFDDTFAFFPIKENIPASTGISSFAVTVNYVDGSHEYYDNNGKGYPLQDAVLLQLPQSCLLGSSGALTVTAAVRNDRVSGGARAYASYKTPQSNSPSPRLQNATIDLAKGDCVGEYTLFSTEWSVPGGLAYESRIDINNGDYSDSFKSGGDFGGTCRPFANPAPCGGSSEKPTSPGPVSPTVSSPAGSPTAYSSGISSNRRN